MEPLTAILVFGLAMSAIALVGSVTLVLPEPVLERLLSPLVGLASGAMLGGALFHMLPAAGDRLGTGLSVYLAVAGGFVVFLFLEHGLHWHHCHRVTSAHRRPVGWLVLLGDGVHNLLGGLAIGALFIVDFRLGLAAWIAAALHEVPQELGDFGVLVASGWEPRQALAYNLVSGLTFLAGGLIALTIGNRAVLDWLVPFAAGNFLYIAAVDLLPELTRECADRHRAVSVGSVLAGLGLVLVPALWQHGL